MTHNRTLFQVDAFTAEPFRGNPAGVCLLDEPVSEAWMQAVASEMNLSETAFVTDGGDQHPIRYFTPAVEVPLCGHATLASAHVLWREGIVAQDRRVHFLSKAGPLGATREGDWICLDLPSHPLVSVDTPATLERAFGLAPESAHLSAGGWHLLVFDSEATLRSLRPQLSVMRDARIDAVSVTAPSESREFDFVSRFFAPGFGIDEDPVTGAAHCSLGPYWSERLRKNDMVGRQISRRGGVVRVRVHGERVAILGQAITVFELKLVL